MQPVLFMPKDRICGEGEEAKDLYLVVRGHVDVCRKEEYLGTISRDNEGFFGEEAVLGIGAGPQGDLRADTCALLQPSACIGGIGMPFYVLRSASGCASRSDRYVASADTSVELMYITRETLVNLVEDFPELGQNIAKYVFDRYKEGRSEIEPVRLHV